MLTTPNGRSGSQWTYEAVEAEQDVEQAKGKGAHAVLRVITTNGVGPVPEG